MEYWLTEIGRMIVVTYIAAKMVSAVDSLAVIATELKTMRLRVCRDEPPKHIRGL